MIWDNHIELPVSVAPLAWVPQRNELVAAPYIASTALTETTAAGSSEIRATPSSIARHPILLPHDD